MKQQILKDKIDLQKQLRQEQVLTSLTSSSLNSYLEFYKLEEFSDNLELCLIPSTINQYQWCGWHFHLYEKAPYIILFHGLFDHTAYMRPLLKTIFQKGFNVLALDLPGHGLSFGAPLECDSFFEYEDQNLSAKNWLLQKGKRVEFEIAHSTGAIGVLESRKYGDQSVRAVLLNPLVKIQFHSFLKKMVKPGSYLLNSIPRLKRRRHPCEEFLEMRSRDPLQPDQVSMKWIRSYFDWVLAFEKQSEKHDQKKILLLQGESDPVVNPHKTFDILEQKFPHHERVLLPQMGHELLFDEAVRTQEVLRLIEREISL